MGNSSTKMRAKNKGLVRVRNLDGKILEFHGPMLVKDLVKNHPNCYVGTFKEATQPLPLTYKLRVERLYYILPYDDCSTRSVKVVITKQQLQRLMARQMGLDKVLSDDPSGSRVPRVMDTIPEGVESSW